MSQEPSRRQSILEVLSSLAKSVPVLKLERIETVYPVFEGKSICLSNGRKLVDKQLAEDFENKNATFLGENGERDDTNEDTEWGEEEEQQEEDEGDGDVVFEYEMDFEGLPRNMTIKSEITEEFVIKEDTSIDEGDNANERETSAEVDKEEPLYVRNENTFISKEGGNADSAITSAEDDEEEPMHGVNEDTFTSENGGNAITNAEDDEEESLDVVNEDTFISEEGGNADNAVTSADDDKEEPMHVVNEDAFISEEGGNIDNAVTSGEDDQEEHVLVVDEDTFISEEQGNADNAIRSAEDNKEESMHVVNEDTFISEEGGNADTAITSAEDDQEEHVLVVNEDVSEEQEDENQEGQEVVTDAIDNTEPDSAQDNDGERITIYGPNGMSSTVIEVTCESQEKEVLDTRQKEEPKRTKKRKWSCDEADVIVLDDNDGAEDSNSHSNESASGPGCSSTSSTVRTRNIQEQKSYGNKAKRKKYSCKVCDQVFDTECAFLAHDCGIEIAPDTHTFICPKCEEVFAELENLKQHIEQCWEGTLNCIICSKKYYGRFMLIKHLQSHKNASTVQFRPTSDACIVCGLFDVNWNLTQHWRTHTGVNLLRCVICKQIKDPVSLLIHLYEHRKNDPSLAGLFWCPDCGMAFFGDCLFTHHRNVHARDVPSYLCECCGIFFMDRVELEVHVLTHIDGNTVFKCNRCLRIYPFREHFEQHVKICFNFNTGIAESDLRDIMNRHLKIFKTYGLGWYPSLKRMPVSNTQQEVNQVQNNRRKDKISIALRKELQGDFCRLYECQICCVMSFGRDRYQTHWREHTGYKPNQCVLCKEVYSSAQMLEIHLVIVHENFESCPECPMVFTNSEQKRSHLRAHENNSTYICEICGIGFDKFPHFELHVLSTHVEGSVPALWEKERLLPLSDEQIRGTTNEQSEVVKPSASRTASRISPPTTDPNIITATKESGTLQKIAVPEPSSVGTLSIEAAPRRKERILLLSDQKRKITNESSEAIKPSASGISSPTDPNIITATKESGTLQKIVVPEQSSVSTRSIKAAPGQQARILQLSDRKKKVTNEENSEAIESSVSRISPPTTDPNIITAAKGSGRLQKIVVPEQSSVSTLNIEAAPRQKERILQLSDQKRKITNENSQAIKPSASGISPPTDPNIIKATEESGTLQKQASPEQSSVSSLTNTPDLKTQFVKMNTPLQELLLPQDSGQVVRLIVDLRNG